MKVDVRTRDFYDRQLSELIVSKYGFSAKDAIRAFLSSETFKMLLDAELEIYKLSPRIVFDMWENEHVTGNPRTSQYIRGDN